VAAQKKSKHRAELAKFEKAWKDLGAPTGDGAEQALRVLLARHGTREGAAKATEAIFEHFVGINEFRIASPKEIGAVIAPHVKNDPETVARHVRGFLRRFFKDHHTLDFTRVEDLTPEGIRKYLDNAIGFPQEMALAMFLQLLKDEIAAEDLADSEEADSKKKRSDREAAVSLDRIRMACAYAAYGESPSKAKLQSGHRKLADEFKFGPPPTEEELEEPIEPTIAELAGSPEVLAKKKIVKKAADKPVAVKKAARKKAAQKKATQKAATKKTARKTTTAKKTTTKKTTTKKAGTTRAAGGARPKTTRATKKARTSSKKSSRR